MNQRVKQLIQKLGEAIHESVSESENIATVVKDIREQGFDVMLMLEATIGLNHVDVAEAEAVADDEQGVFTRNDLSFLKSLRISLPEGESGSEVETESGEIEIDPASGRARPADSPEGGD